MYLDPKTFADIQDELNRSVFAFLPELILCGTIVLLLLFRLFKALDRWHMGEVALVFTLAALAVSLGQWIGPKIEALRVMTEDDGWLIYLNYVKEFWPFLSPSSYGGGNK